MFAAPLRGGRQVRLGPRTGSRLGSGCGGGEQLADPHQVVGRTDEVRRQLRALEPSEARLPEIRDGLGPAKDLLDALSDDLADRVASVSGGASIDRRAAARSFVLRDVRGDVALAAVPDKAARVVALVASERDPLRAGEMFVDHLDRRIALGGARRGRDLDLDE